MLESYRKSGTAPKAKSPIARLTQALEANRDKFSFWMRDKLRPYQRIVTKMPLAELWDDTGTLLGQRVRSLDQNLLRELVGTVPVQFVVADCGSKLNWIPMQERFEFWKTIRPHVADPRKPIHLQLFPNETAFVASEWRGRAAECLILLEAHH